MNAIVAEPTPTAVEVMLGAPGSACGVARTAADGCPSPIALTALIRTEYCVPFTSPAMAMGVAVAPDETQLPLPLSS